MDVQKDLIEKILKNELNEVNDILSRHQIKPDTCDEHGMSLLQHAAYKGNREMVRLLLDRGADVNSGKHEFGYTALHFAALSGNTAVCQLLLEHGAKTYATNSVGRTPSQMAAFVGNHDCVTTINNFVPKSDIDQYTKPSGSSGEPKLPPLASGPLHKLVMEVNLNPVRIAMNLMKSPLLCEHMEKVRNVLEMMSEKEMKNGLETNEIMSFKFHYLRGILGQIIDIKNSMKSQNNKSSDETTPVTAANAIEVFIKRMLTTSNGTVLEYQENVLKDIIRRFPNRECTTYRQMVCTLARNDSPGALSLITSIVNGQRGFVDSDSFCATCGGEKGCKKCSQCKSVQYCDRECQKYHWFVHKKFCGKGSAKPTKKAEKSKQEAILDATSALQSEMENLKTS